MEPSLASWISQHGQPAASHGNQPVLLHPADSAWWVETGPVDLFLVTLVDGQPHGRRTHLLRTDSGQLLLGLPTHPAHALLAVGALGARLRHLTRPQLQLLLQSSQLQQETALALDRWILTLSQSLASDLTPKVCLELVAGSPALVPAQQPARPNQGVAWVKAASGTASYLPHLDTPIDLAAGWWPIPTCTALSPATDTHFEVGDTLFLGNLTDPLPHLHRFHQLVLDWAGLHLRRIHTAESNRLATKAQARHRTVATAIADLASVLTSPPPTPPSQDDAPDPTLAALHLVGTHLGVTFRPHPDLKKGRPLKDPLGKITAASRLRQRRVVLSDRWWTHDNGPLLGFLQESNRPVALLPSGADRYVLADPSDGSRTHVTPEIVQSLKPIAYTFYRPLPSTPLVVTEIIRFGLHRCQTDLTTIVLMALAGGLLGLLTPIATGILFDRVIPGAEQGPLLHITLGLLVAAVAGVLFHITRSIALLRVETRSEASIQSAVWDRLLGLPPPFFRNYTAGDLALRANGIDAVRQIMSDALVNLTLGGLSALLSLALLFYYSPTLAFVAVGLVALALAASLAASLLNLRYQAPLCELQGRISGLVLQFITGITKLRVAGAEGHAFAVWARLYAAEKHLDRKSATVSNAFNVFDTIYPTLTSMALFASMAHLTSRGLSTGDFLAFNAAFGGFLGAMLGLSSSFLALVDAIPIYQRARPILEAQPENDQGKTDPGDLSGHLELTNLRFRYRPDGPLVLHDLSLIAQPGEFVAIVGPSGSGKSTLLRLLLGFERPEAGSILYDGMDLAGLDVQAVRRQLGVVLQSGKLMPGSIFDNIVGTSALTLEDAWRAAEQAGLAEDIDNLPMGMHTVLSEGAGTLSGGQRQRLMIARALVAQPRILLFDEATSALDNRTQAVVSESLDRLQATRIVIAHRLSTVLSAHRILVLQAGRLIQSGTYQELLRQPGLFAELARRQLV